MTFLLSYGIIRAVKEKQRLWQAAAFFAGDTVGYPGSSIDYRHRITQLFIAVKSTKRPTEIGVAKMAKTKSSVRGKQQKKIVVVKPYTKKDGTKVPEHRRSTPN